VARFPYRAVAGEMSEKLHHGDLRAVFGCEAGEAIGALSRATPAGDADDDVGVGGEDVGGHCENITRTCGVWKLGQACARRVR